MNHPAFILYARPWWQQRRWRIALAALAGSAAVLIWWTSDAANAEHEPVVVLHRLQPSAAAKLAPAAQGARLLDAPVRSEHPVAVQPAPQPTFPAPLSTLVAPGIHVTPLSVPPDTVPTPAGPGSHDSEPEN